MATDADSSKAEMKRNVWSEELSDFLEGIDSYKSTVPEAVIKYYLQKGGATIFDERIVKVVAIAADKFLAGEICKNNNSSIFPFLPFFFFYASFLICLLSCFIIRNAA